jgi:glycosyltransferase involved in cell wall biosynthesis
MLLSILIPTFNRQSELERNLRLLSAHLVQLDCLDRVEIVVSNNASIDGTDLALRRLCDELPVTLSVISQHINIGLERNTLAVLAQATGRYVMFLGDDDYVTFKFIAKVVDEICKPDAVTAIIPSFLGYFYEKNRYVFGRDIDFPTQRFRNGVKSLVRNAARGHQMSGLVMRNDQLHATYCAAGVSNLYPFIFFLCTALMNGDSLHFTAEPILVTQRPQSEKNWDYGDDGLIFDILDNYRALTGITYLTRVLLEGVLFWQQESRYVAPTLRHPIWIIYFLKKLFSSKKATLPGKIIFCLMLPFMPLKFYWERARRQRVMSLYVFDTTFVNPNVG